MVNDGNMFLAPVMRIGDRSFSEGHACIVAEIAQAHDGSLGMAHAYIDAIAQAGADAVKFQTHIAAAESTVREPWRVKFSRQDSTRHDYWRRMEFTEEQWRGLKTHADDRGLLFLSSPFSPEAIELLLRVGVPAWKVASGEVSNWLLVRQMLATRLPMIVSSGMSSVAELDRVMRLCRDEDVPCAVLQCTTAYPCPPEKVGLNQLAHLRERYGVPVGLSDHSGVTHAGLAAATLGAAFIEVHVTFHRAMFGPDVPASLTCEELRHLVEGVRFIEKMRACPVDKDAEAAGLEGMRRTFGKSVVARRALPAGHALAVGDTACKKPADGIPAGEQDRVFGRRLKRAVAVDEALQWSDLE